jgi:hypothetical protein
MVGRSRFNHPTTTNAPSGKEVLNYRNHEHYFFFKKKKIKEFNKSSNLSGFIHKVEIPQTWQ